MIIAPLGWPVDPDVYMTYARFEGSAPAAGFPVASLAIIDQSESRQTVLSAEDGNKCLHFCSVSNMRIPESSTMNDRRSGG